MESSISSPLPPAASANPKGKGPKIVVMQRRNNGGSSSNQRSNGANEKNQVTLPPPSPPSLIGPLDRLLLWRERRPMLRQELESSERSPQAQLTRLHRPPHPRHRRLSSRALQMLACLPPIPNPTVTPRQLAGDRTLSHRLTRRAHSSRRRRRVPPQTRSRRRAHPRRRSSTQGLGKRRRCCSVTSKRRDLTLTSLGSRQVSRLCLSSLSHE
jgi:hypothetical protein